jgi:hypothetical protein
MGFHLGVQEFWWSPENDQDILLLSETEEQVYRVLGFTFLSPEDRELASTIFDYGADGVMRWPEWANRPEGKA